MNNYRFFGSVNQPAGISYSMGNGVPGSFDNLKLQPGGDSEWRKVPNNIGPQKNCKRFFVAQGTPLPLKHEMQFVPLPEDSMFIFDKSISSPECCPATFSTDRGCVCTDKKMRDFIGQRRGGNVNYPNEGL